VAHIGGNVAKASRTELEGSLGESVVTNDSRLDYQYIETKQIEEKLIKVNNSDIYN